MTDVKARLRTEWDRAVAQITAFPAVVRVGAPVADLPPVAWLSGQPFQYRAFWKSRDTDFQAAAAGVAYECSAFAADALSDRFEEMRMICKSGPEGVRFYGGTWFAAEPICAPEWAPFLYSRFFLPRFELIQSEGGGYLVCQAVMFGADEIGTVHASVLHDLDRLVILDESGNADLPSLCEVSVTPTHSEWTHQVTQILSLMDQGSLHKVVLARRKELRYAEPFSASQLLPFIPLFEPQSFHFFFQFRPDSGFAGSSPECLFRLSGDRLYTEAVAGTRPRGDSPEEDRRLGLELEKSPKERSEHQWVVSYLENRLAGLCRSVSEKSSPTLLKLTTLQHLLLRFQGVVKPDIHAFDILSALHPTPAVCGDPPDAALAVILEAEPFSRGWFSGPVGWVGADACEFAVAIRSVLQHQDRLMVFSGAGIVPQSQPEPEWEELNQKSRFFDALFAPAECAHVG